MHGDPGHFVVDRLDLARMYADSNIEPERSNHADDRVRAPHCASRTVESREEAVTRRVYLRTSVADEKAADRRAMAFDDLTPRAALELIYKLRSLLG